MKNLATRGVPTGLLLALLLGACTTVPNVEDRLSQLRFYPNMYVVQAGDTLETIAFRYELDPAELASLNPGSGDDLRPGMRINVKPGTTLPDEVRAAARVARGPARLSSGPAAEARASVGTQTPTYSQPVQRQATATQAEPRPEMQPVPQATTQAVPRAVAPAQAPVVIAQSDPASQAPVPQPAQPPTVIVEQASFDPVTGGAPNEQVVPDDLDGYVPQPSADTSAALTSEGASTVGGWVWPTDGAVARGYTPGTIGGQGIDIAGVPGQDVRAASAGTVVYSGRDLSGGGNLVILRHEGDLMTTYSHTDRLFVTEDDRVRAGDPIASLGTNADSESVLRFEVRRDGAPLDPLSFVSERR